MKISDIIIENTRIPLRKVFRTSQREAREVQQVTIEIKCCDKIGKSGTCATTKVTGETIESITSIIKNVIFPEIKGMDIFYINKILQKVQNSVPHNYSAKAAVDMALYDLYSKCIGISLGSLWGIAKTSLETSLTISIDTVDQMLIDAQEALELGFKYLKIKMGQNYKQDLILIEEINRATQNRMKLRLDANQGWSRREALTIIRKLEVYTNIEFVEQPVKAHDIDGLKWLKGRVNVPIMADESMFTYSEAVDIIKKNAADLINIKLLKCGGIFPSQKIVSLAESSGIECMLGCMLEGAESLVFSIFFACSQPNITKVDLDSLYFLKSFDIPNNIHYEKGKINLVL